MPEGIDGIPMSQLLTYEELIQICEAAALLGIRKLKITGGEPLVRKGCTEFIQGLKKIPGIDAVTMTTNGVFLKQYAQILAQCQIDGINVSLDTLQRDTYQKITGEDVFGKVWAGIESILELGIKTKVNTVLQPGINEQDWEELVELPRKYPLDVRFIEMMPIGYGRNYTVVSNQEILEKIEKKYPDLEEDFVRHGNGPAVYYRIPEFQGSIGFISAIHGRFCSSCNRIRLTSVGKLKPCLCYEDFVDMRDILRNCGGKGLKEAILEAVRKKPKQHCFEEEEVVTEKNQMVQIGG